MKRTRSLNAEFLTYDEVIKSRYWATTIRNSVCIPKKIRLIASPVILAVMLVSTIFGIIAQAITYVVIFALDIIGRTGQLAMALYAMLTIEQQTDDEESSL